MLESLLAFKCAGADAIRSCFAIDAAKNSHSETESPVIFKIQGKAHTFMTLELTIAMRESHLALWQANQVKQLLEAEGHQVTLMGMTTLGDQILDQPLSKIKKDCLVACAAS